VGAVGVLAGLTAIVLFFVASSIVLRHQRELGIRPDEPVDQAEIQQRMTEMILHLDRHPWLATMLAFFGGSAFCWMVGLVCSVVGMSRRYRSHAAAVVGLIIALVPLILFCAGVLGS